MSSLNLEKIRKAYIDIWCKYENGPYSDVLKRGFTFQYDDFGDVDVLFLGINPAYTLGEERSENSYSLEQSLYFPYFKEFKNVEEKLLSSPYNLKIRWTHLDIMVFRETNQKYIETELFRTQEGLDFIMAQLQVAKARIEDLNPKVIVASNALVRKLIGKERGGEPGQEYNVWMGLKMEFDNEVGTDRIIENPKLPNTHVFFTSMLSGQRALDNGSKERLIWHINEVLKEKNT
jgi:hypothetical protein